MNLATGEESLRPRIHLTPLIDVIFLVLVAYIEATLFLTAGAALPIDLPRAQGARAPAAAPTLHLTIAPDSALYLDRQPLPAAELEPALRTRLAVEPELALHVHADRRAPVEPLVRILELARELGIRGVVLATEGERASAVAAEAPP